MDGTCGGGCGVKGQTWHLPTAVAGDTGGVQTGIDSGAVLVAVYSTEETSEKQPSTS